MSVAALRPAARQLGLWGSLLLVVALLTLLFNILGIITAAVATGVVLGASRRWKWQAIPASAVFALAGLALMQVAKADLKLAQRLWMAGLSVGAFWGMYLLTLFFMCLEKAPAAGTGALPVGSAAPLEPRATDETSPPLGLRDFQGRWLCETAGRDGPASRRIMEIAEHRFTLRIQAPNGCARLVAEGEMILENAAAVTLRVGVVPARQEPPPTDA
jgi:hypothetical protein